MDPEIEKTIRRQLNEARSAGLGGRKMVFSTEDGEAFSSEAYGPYDDVSALIESQSPGSLIVRYVPDYIPGRAT